jgi:hypothetical protein
MNLLMTKKDIYALGVPILLCSCTDLQLVAYANRGTATIKHLFNNPTGLQN